MPRRSCCQPPVRPPFRRATRGGGGGFSLVELLVVIGIIAVLIGILIPVVGRMRREAYKVDTAALINTIRSAAEAYQTNFKAYPGPFADNDAYSGTGIPAGISGPPTGTEQLVLSLCGGLKLGNNNITWSPGSYFTTDSPPVLVMPGGPANLNPRHPKTYPPFISDAARHVATEWDGTSNFRDSMGNAAQDSNLPEFVDRYPEPLPILYLRARRGMPGIISDGSKAYQYDLRQIAGYTKMGEGNASGPHHGLRKLGDAQQSIRDSMKANKGGADALPYFRISGSTLPSGFNAANQAGASPRSQDSYILISAGPDRLYGTYDDITSFGPVE